MEQNSLFSQPVAETSTVRNKIEDLLKSVSNRMYRGEFVQREITEIETFLSETAYWSRISPENLIEAAQEIIKDLPNLTAIQAIRIAAGVRK